LAERINRSFVFPLIQATQRILWCNGIYQEHLPPRGTRTRRLDADWLEGIW
jgi:hypothetical protein